MQTETLLQERGTTHGSFRSNAVYAQRLREMWRASLHWDEMPVEHKEALDMLACKLSRILSGQSRFAGHWEDIRGYAQLAEDVCVR